MRKVFITVGLAAALASPAAAQGLGDIGRLLQQNGLLPAQPRQDSQQRERDIYEQGRRDQEQARRDDAQRFDSQRDEGRHNDKHRREHARDDRRQSEEWQRFEQDRQTTDRERAYEDSQRPRRY